jgi:nucleotide-binding universal stress UspA family protein
MSDPPVTVGVTSSPTSYAAVRWAAGEAASRNRRLRIVHVTDYDTGVPAWHRHARGVVARGAGVARAAVPDVAVETAVRAGRTLPLLAQEAANCELLVLGAIGHGHLSDGPSDPVLNRLLARQSGPIAVVHAGTANQRGPVAVGIRDPYVDEQLLHVAYDHARRWGVGLRIVHAQRFRDGGADARSTLEDVARRWQERPEPISVTVEFADGRPFPVLLHVSHDARLLVVGTRTTTDRPHVRFTGVGLAHAAHCPVLLAPQTAGPEPAGSEKAADAAGRG